jgi:subtilisin family serine protease
MSRLIAPGVVLLAVIGILPMSAVGQTAAAGAEPSAQPPPNVDEAVADAVAASGTTDFWVVFRDKADLSDAAAIDDWAARGQHVYDELTRTATETQADLAAALDTRNIDHQSFWLVNALYVRGGDQATLDLVRNRPEVAEVRAPRTYDLPEPIVGADDPSVDAVEWGVANIRANEAWAAFGTTGEGVVVANIDTGVEYTHPALVNQYRGTLGGGSFDHNYNWFDPGGDNCATAPCDTDGHGTHTMGTMIGSDGGANQIGVAPGAKWMSALGCPFGGCPDFDLLSSGQFVMAPTDLNGQNPRPDLRANIINNSWGSANGPFEDPFFTDVVDAWTAAGIFGVFSNGNDGPSCDTAGGPADYRGAWGVGAYDINDNIAFFSSRGPAGDPGDEYTKPNIAAPGVDVRSSLPGSSYGSLSGTSMAAPHQAGTVALMWAASPEIMGDITATRTLLSTSARDTSDLSCGGTAENNNVFGEGRLDAFAAVELSPRGPSGSLTGTISVAGSGGPLAAASVTATVEGRPRTTRTGPDGVYTFGSIPVGTVDVEASAIGYRPASGSADITEGQTTTLDLEVAPLPKVVGTVTDANDGAPLAGATLTATSGGDTRSTTSGADGSYVLYLDLGTWTITVDKDGYATSTEEVVVDQDGETIPLDIALRSAAAAVDPDSIETVLLTDTQRSFDVHLTNPGTATLDWEAFERGGGTVEGQLEWLQAPDPAALSLQSVGESNTGAAGLATQATAPSAARWTPDVAAPEQASILVYADDPVHPAPNTYVDQALQRIGLGYTAFYDSNFAGFENALAQGGWDLVVFEDDNFIPLPSTFDALNAYVVGGGKLIAHSWRVEATAMHPLWASMGAHFVSSDFDPPDPVHWWEADHPLFTDPESVPELTQLQSGIYGIYGQRVDPLTSEFQALAGYTAAPAASQAAMILGNGDRTLFRGFLDGQNDADLDADGVRDGVEMWENSILGIEQGFFVDVPWLDVTPDSGSVDAGGSQDLDVTIDTTGLAPGVYGASIVLATNASRQPRVTIPVRLVVSPYMQAVNVGGRSYTDVAGNDWAADRRFDGTWGFEYTSKKITTRRAISGTEDDPLYQDARTGRVFTYRFENLPDGVYEVNLHFAEIEGREPSRRLFDVTADTTPLLIGYDIAEDVGKNAAVVQTFTVEVTDGQLRIRFLSRDGFAKPILNALELTNRPDLSG